MHVKSEYSIFFNQKEKLLFKEIESEVTRKMSSRRRRSRKQKIKQKRRRKTEVNAKRDEQKQKVMKKGCKKHVMKEKKRMFFMREW